MGGSDLGRDVHRTLRVVGPNAEIAGGRLAYHRLGFVRGGQAFRRGRQALLTRSVFREIYIRIADL